MTRSKNQPVCLRCNKSGAGVEFPLFPRTGVAFGDVCAVCDDNSPWLAVPLVCVECEVALEEPGCSVAFGNRKYGEPRCEDCHRELEDAAR